MKNLQLIWKIITSLSVICGLIDFYFNYIKTGKMEFNYHYLLYGFVFLTIIILFIIYIFGKIQDSFDNTNNLKKAQLIVNDKILEQIKHLYDSQGIPRPKSLFTESEKKIMKILTEDDKPKK